MSQNKNVDDYPDSQVLMLVGTFCAHCGPVLASLSELVKEGAIESLAVINVEKRPDVAATLGVQSVPWLRIGWFELEGVRTKAELKRWAESLDTTEGVSEYYSEILGQGRVKQCLGFLEQHPGTMSSIIRLMADPDEKINVRLGIGVIMEEWAARDDFRAFVPDLLAHLTNDDARVRQDVCHYLSLTGDSSLVPDIEPLLEDVDADVREEAEESLAALREHVRH